MCTAPLRAAFLSVVVSTTILTAEILTAEILAADDVLSEFDALGSNGGWQQQEGDIVQAHASDPSTVLLSKVGEKSRVRARVRVRLDPTEKIGAEAGLVVHAENKDYYVICAIRRNKGGYYAMLTRYGRGYDWGRLPGDMARLPEETATDWHTVEMVADGAHVRATVDGSIELAFSFPRLADGMPICVGDQGKDIRLASNWGPEMFHMQGRVGLATRHATARFGDLEIEDLPPEVVVHTPHNPEFDENGRVRARWPYATIMRRYTEWFLESRNLVTHEGGNKEAREAKLGDVMEQTGWPPYFFSWATVIDDMGFDHPTQFATHNGPPTIVGYIHYYLFSGDRRCINAAKQWADWVIDEFSTPADFPFPFIPKSNYSYIDVAYEKHLLGTLELDKASYMGLAYLQLYAVTADEKYLVAAQRIAETLRQHQNDDGSMPFRVNLETGEIDQPYTCSQLWHAQLFRNLHELTGRAEYRDVSNQILAWMIDGPIRTNQWWGFYGDNPDAGASKSFDQWVALETAQWLLDHVDENKAFLPAAEKALQFIEDEFVRMGGVHEGVPAIGEQTGWPAILPHHNMRFAKAYACLFAVTGEPRAKEMALRIGNSMSQMVMNDGKFHHGLNSGIVNRTCLILCCNFNYGRLMAEFPETAPPGENHLLYFSGYVGDISYESGRIRYEALIPGQEILVVASKPTQVLAAGQVLAERESLPASRATTGPAGWIYEQDAHRLIVLHPKGTIEIEL